MKTTSLGGWIIGLILSGTLVGSTSIGSSPKQENPSSQTPACPAPPADLITKDAERFTSLLGSSVAGRRVDGLQGLSDLKHWPSESAVLRLLDDPSPQVRREAVLALGRCGTAKTIPRFLDLLNDPSWELRENVYRSLQRMTAQDFPSDQSSEWRAWWESSDGAAKEKALLTLAEEPLDPTVATANVRTTRSGYVPGAPGRRGGRRRSGLLPPAHPQRHDALRALVHMAGPSAESGLLHLLTAPLTPPLDPEERDFICQAVERVGSARSIPILGAQRSDAAAWALGALGGWEAEQALWSFPKSLSVLLALDRLHSTNAGPLIPQLVAQMGLITFRSQPDDITNVEQQPIQRVGANLIRRSGLAPLLEEVVLQKLEDTMNPPAAHGPRPDMPPGWAEMLQRMESELKPGFVREDGTTTSQPVAALCYTTQNAALIPRLIPLLRHPAVVVRVYIALTLANLGARESAEEIMAIVREGYAFNDAVALASGKHFDQSQTVRWRGFLCLALGRMGGEEARLALEAWAGDPQQPRDIRYGSVVGLDFIRSPQSLPVLERVAREDIIWMVRDEARRAVQTIRDNQP